MPLFVRKFALFLVLNYIFSKREMSFLLLLNPKQRWQNELPSFLGGNLTLENNILNRSWEFVHTHLSQRPWKQHPPFLSGEREWTIPAGILLQITTKHRVFWNFITMVHFKDKYFLSEACSGRRGSVSLSWQRDPSFCLLPLSLFCIFGGTNKTDQENQG